MILAGDPGEASRRCIGPAGKRLHQVTDITWAGVHP